MEQSLTSTSSEFLTHAGLETDLIFRRNVKLDYFCAFIMLRTEAGCQILNDYYHEFLTLAVKYNKNFILETPTWRSSMDWAAKLCIDQSELSDLNRKAITLMKKLKNEYSNQIENLIISGQIGPRGDGYQISLQMGIVEAKNYHLMQLKTFQEAGVEICTAMTINYIAEALGIVLAAKGLKMPIVISFTTETDGNLPSGETLEEAIKLIDTQTNEYPLYYMLNCCHPSHFYSKLIKIEEKYLKRIQGIRCNASKLSHKELDVLEELDRGDLNELAELYLQIKKNLPFVRIFGGCCGTDSEHIKTICEKLFT